MLLNNILYFIVYLNNKLSYIYYTYLAAILFDEKEIQLILDLKKYSKWVYV